MLIQVGNEIAVSDYPLAFKKWIKSKLTLPNPLYVRAKKYGDPDRLRFIKKEVIYFDIDEPLLYFPRGIIKSTINWCIKNGEPYETQFQTTDFSPIDIKSNIILEPDQTKAFGKIIKSDFGVLEAPTGNGKTIIALKVIAHRKQPSLIVVHTKELLKQWIDRVETFLELRDIGIIGDGKKEIRPVTVALVQTLHKMPQVHAHFGHLIVDECHRVPAKTFTDAVSASNAKYMLGLTATPWRGDGLGKIIQFYMGNIVYKTKKSVAIKEGRILQGEVYFKKTEMYFHPKVRNYSKMMSRLIRDDKRNRQIAEDVMGQKGRSLVVSDRVLHCVALHWLLSKKKIPCAILTGKTHPIARREALKDLQKGKIKVLIATSQLVGEGLDIPVLNNLFLAMPIKSDLRLIQYVGRVLRTTAGKTSAKVFDYVDHKSWVLLASAKKRKEIYLKQGIEIKEGF